MFTFRIPREPSTVLRIGVINLGNNNVEDLQIEIVDDLHAEIKTEHSFMRLIYVDANNDIEETSQVELSVNIPGETYPFWTTLMNEIPREVIFTAVAILRGDDHAEQYRIRRNNNGHILSNNVNDPGFSNENLSVPAPARNNNNEPSTNNSAAGGRRKTRKSKKKGRKPT